MSRLRVSTLLLEGCIRDPAMRNDLLGDLEEERAEREVHEGLAAANSWYRRQALRALPYLFRDWWFRTPWYLLLGTLVGALVIRIVTGFLGLAAMLSVGILLQNIGMNRSVTTALATCVSAVFAFAGGMLMAMLHRKAPAPAIVFLALVVVVTTAQVNALERGLLMPWYLVIEKLLVVPATLLGALYVIHRRQQTPTPHTMAP